ncbi:hypothetical protein ACFV0R_24775 [Streptomyces sp. NPDC059578]|uniref:hypothetical protein n=1 Tax=Streptomyces sp. NPDC059578 TaxID=3346874 RepID=UPI0036B31B2F
MSPLRNRNDCTAWEPSGTKAAVGRTTVITDGGYRSTGLLIPRDRRRKGDGVHHAILGISCGEETVRAALHQDRNVGLDLGVSESGRAGQAAERQEYGE